MYQCVYYCYYICTGYHIVLAKGTGNLIHFHLIHKNEEIELKLMKKNGKIKKDNDNTCFQM